MKIINDAQIIKAYEKSEIKGKKSFARASKSLGIRKATFLKKYHELKGTKPKPLFPDNFRVFRERISLKSFFEKRVKYRKNWQYQLILNNLKFERNGETRYVEYGFSKNYQIINWDDMFTEAVSFAMMQLKEGSEWSLISYEHVELYKYKWMKPVGFKKYGKMMKDREIRESLLPKKVQFTANSFEKRDPRHHPNLALDIENDPETGRFICMGVAGEIKKQINGRNKNKYIEKYFENLKDATDFLQHLQKKYMTTQATNLVVFNGGYDVSFIKEICEPLRYNSSKFITTRLLLPENEGNYRVKRGLPIFDLTNHVKGTLESWIDRLDMKEKYDISKFPLEYGANYKENNIEYHRRVMNDARATYKLSCFIEDFWVDMGAKFKLTAPSSALNLWKNITQKKDKPKAFNRSNKVYVRKWNENRLEIDKIETKAYYGGHTECFVRGKHLVQSFDVVSMYTYQMKEHDYPDSTDFLNVKFNVLPDKNALFGIWHVKINLPKTLYGILPYKEKYNSLTLYPTGIIKGYWTKYEIDYAISLGASIIKTYSDSINYYSSIKPFKKYIDLLYPLKAMYKKEANEGMKELVKVSLNSLYGKFGQHTGNESVTYKLNELPSPDIIEGKRVTNVFDFVTNELLCIISGGKKEDMTNETCTAIAAHVTSYARVYLHKKIKEVENKGYKVAYCDTDSTHVIVKDKSVPLVIDSSNKLGAFEHEYTRHQTYYREKYYLSDDEFKCKGVPKKHIVLSDDDDELKIQFSKPNKYKESIRRGLIINKWEDKEKVIQKGVSKKRVWDGDISQPHHF